MQALRKLGPAVSANDAPATRRKDGATLAYERDRLEGEDVRGPRLFDLKPAMPRYICVGFAVFRI